MLQQQHKEQHKDNNQKHIKKRQKFITKKKNKSTIFSLFFYWRRRRKESQERDRGMRVQVRGSENKFRRRRRKSFKLNIIKQKMSLFYIENKKTVYK